MALRPVAISVEGMGPPDARRGRRAEATLASYTDIEARILRESPLWIALQRLDQEPEDSPAGATA